MKKSVNNKAQITVFIIVALVVIVIIGILFYVIKNTGFSELDREYFAQESIKPQVENIQNSIVNCMKDTTKNSLDVIGIQGGYYNEPPYYYNTGDFFIPYYFYEGRIFMPSKKQVEEELGGFVDENLVYCLKDLNFEGFKLKFRKITTIARISENDEVIFNIDGQVIIEKDNKKMILELKEYPISQFSYLYRILEVAKYITDSHMDDPDMMCINCIVDMAFRREVYVDFLKFNEDTETLVIITENKTSSYPYIYEFLNKYVIEVQNTA